MWLFARNFLVSDGQGSAGAGLAAFEAVALSVCPPVQRAGGERTRCASGNKGALACQPDFGAHWQWSRACEAPPGRGAVAILPLGGESKGAAVRSGKETEGAAAHGRRCRDGRGGSQEWRQRGKVTKDATKQWCCEAKFLRYCLHYGSSVL